MTVRFTGEVHPFLSDLPIFDAEVESIAESIREIGLIHPVTLDSEGRLIGGRHRLTACERVGIEPTFETWDGDPLAFILHDNDSRKHQTVGQRAAELALSLGSAGRRNGGRWAYGKDEISQVGKSTQNRLSQCGLILDSLGRESLLAIAQGDLALDAAFKQAERKRDEERQQLAEVERMQAEEDDARKRLTDLAPEYMTALDNGEYRSARQAFAAWEDDNRAAAARERQERAKEDADRAARQQTAENTARSFGQVLAGLEGLTYEAHRKHLRDWWTAGSQAVPPASREFYNPTRIREFAQALLTYADELEQCDG